MKQTSLKIWVIASACAYAMSTCAYALSLTDFGVVGTVKSGEPASIENEIIYSNQLLSMGANQTQTIDYGGSIGSHDFATGTKDYMGTLSGGVKLEAEISPGVPNPTFTLDVSGYEWVFAKYDGPNGGGVLFNVADYGTTIPLTSLGIWENAAGKGYGISHWTGFGSTNSVPDGGMTAMLLGTALAGLGVARRFLMG